MYNYACLFLDHWKHWHGVQWDGSWLQASHPQSQKDGTGSVKKIVFGLLSSLLPLKDYYLMYHETIPTAQLVYRVALVMQEYTQSGGVSKIMFMSGHCYVIKSYNLHGWCQAPNANFQVRPFGVSLLICGWDEPGKPLLFQVRFFLQDSLKVACFSVSNLLGL